MNRRHRRAARRDAVWWAGLVVAGAAAAATAHGLYAVAAASSVPWPVAVLYPVMTDGLALVAYSATNRLTDGPRRYAWTVVVIAAGLSGGAQALYLAGGGLNDAPSAVRFGIGAAPALAAAAVAHLLHLIRTTVPTADVLDASVQPLAKPPSPCVPPAATVAARRRPNDTPQLAPAGAADRARKLALEHREEHGSLPTVTALVQLARVSRGTAGTVLKGLRATAADGSASTPVLDPAHEPAKIQSDHTPMHHDPEEDQLQGRPARARAAR